MWKRPSYTNPYTPVFKYVNTKYYQENKKLHILKPKTFDNYNKEQKLKANSYHLDKSGNVVGWHIGGKVKGSKTLDIIEEIKNDFD